MVQIEIFRVTTAFVVNKETLTKDSTRFLPENIFVVIHSFDISQKKSHHLVVRVEYLVKNVNSSRKNYKSQCDDRNGRRL